MAEITKYTGNNTVLSIPAQVDGYAVMSIGDGTFSYGYSLKEITLPGTLAEIGADAFYGCPEDALFTVPGGSLAEEWCKENGKNYTYPDANDWI